LPRSRSWSCQADRSAARATVAAATAGFDFARAHVLDDGFLWLGPAINNSVVGSEADFAADR